MKQELEQIREQLLTLLNKVDELIDGGDGKIDGKDIKHVIDREKEKLSMRGPDLPKPPDPPSKP